MTSHYPGKPQASVPVSDPVSSIQSLRSGGAKSIRTIFDDLYSPACFDLCYQNILIRKGTGITSRYPGNLKTPVPIIGTS